MAIIDTKHPSAAKIRTFHFLFDIICIHHSNNRYKTYDLLIHPIKVGDTIKTCRNEHTYKVQMLFYENLHEQKSDNDVFPPEDCCRLQWVCLSFSEDFIRDHFVYAPSQWVTTLQCNVTWWRHQIETFSALLALCAGQSLVTGEFTEQRPVTRSFDVFFDLRLNKRLSKPSWG